MELAARFETTFDAGDVGGHLATWVDDLSFESPFGSYQGKDAYRAWVEAFNRVAMAGGGTRHLVTNFEIDLAGDTATMTCYLTILSAGHAADYRSHRGLHRRPPAQGRRRMEVRPPHVGGRPGPVGGGHPGRSDAHGGAAKNTG
jgi:hypothetical protein